MHFITLIFISTTCSAQEQGYEATKKSLIDGYRSRYGTFRNKILPFYEKYERLVAANQFRQALVVLDEIKDQHYGTEFRYGGDLEKRFDCFRGMKDWISLLKFESIDPALADHQYAFLAEAHFRIGNYKRASIILETKTNSYSFLKKGRLDMPKELGKRDIEAWIKIHQGYFYNLKGGSKTHRAMSCFVEANRIRPNTPICLYFIGNCYLDDSKVEEGKAALRKLAELPSPFFQSLARAQLTNFESVQKIPKG